MIKLTLSKKESENLTKDEIEIAKARKLEILILPFLRRNMQFFYAGGDLPGKAKAYNQPINEKELEETLLTKKNNIPTVCKPLCKMVAEILQENGIQADTISCDTDMFRHTDVIITTQSGKKYIINYLEDIENIQTGMKTPDFASKAYYERRYQKFENSLTTDGKSIKGIDFLTSEQLKKIDNNLGYTKYNMYMNDVIKQIKLEFSDFKNIMAENEWLEKEYEIKKSNSSLTTEEIDSIKEGIFNRYNNMTPDEVLEKKLDWIFNYFNQRMDIKGHSDFVMYYSRLLLKEVLSEQEYSKITRYDCFTNPKNIPTNSKLTNILDFNNEDNASKSRFCMIQHGDNAYLFSTKPNSYLKINANELSEFKEYANFSKAERPSDLMLYLCDRGNALPLVFHPLGSKLLNERAELIPEMQTEEERKNLIQELSSQIKTTDEPITSILIPYPNGEKKYIYINSNNEFVVKTENKETIYHYNKESDTFDEEIIEGFEK